MCIYLLFLFKKSMILWKVYKIVFQSSHNFHKFYITMSLKGSLLTTPSLLATVCEMSLLKNGENVSTGLLSQYSFPDEKFSDC